MAGILDTVHSICKRDPDLESRSLLETRRLFGTRREVLR